MPADPIVGTPADHRRAADRWLRRALHARFDQALAAPADEALEALARRISTLIE